MASEAGERIDPYKAVEEYPVLEPLLALAERTDTGWEFVGSRRTNGELAAILGTRFVRHSHVDFLVIYSHARVVVARAKLVGEDAGKLLVNLEGTPEHVIPKLLALPEVVA